MVDIIKDLLDILGEASPHCREVIKRAIQEIEEGRIKHLQDKAMIDELEEQFVSFFKFTVEALEDTCKALEVVRPGIESRAFINDTKKRVETASPEGRPYAVVGRIRTAVEMMKETPPISAVEPVEEKFAYSLKTRTENRALAIADFMRRTGKSSIKSTEARIVLEDIEGQTLDRTIVKRAMDKASKLLRAPKNIFGGVARLVLPAPLTAPTTSSSSEEPGGVSLSRHRRTGQAWGG